MANNLWSNYTEKTATPVDADEVMVRDSTDGKNKRLLFGTFWKWVAKKLNEATISELETDNKTIIGAINALNGKPLFSNIGDIAIEISNTINNPVKLAFPIDTEFLYVSYGIRNDVQSYGGATLIIDAKENKPCFVPVYINANVKGYLYLYSNSGTHKLEIYGINLQVVMLVKVKGR